jgi:UDP:flavonoid glycosyltransferase YjiC (YdhE family)
LQQQRHKVIIAADGRALDFLRAYFPELEFIRMPGFRVAYPQGNNMTMKMILKSPAIFYHIYKEHRNLKKIIRDCRADVVISDNRFGLWSKQIYSVYLTHQVMIKAPEGIKWLEPKLYRLHGWFIKHYDECWIPDIPGEENLSGDLGHSYPVPQNGSFIGILSRFENMEEQAGKADRDLAPDLLIMLSGPEPQRSILESMVLKELIQHDGLKTVILQGLPGKIQEQTPNPGLSIFNHLPDPEMRRLIRKSKVIICRPGYSTIMDLAMLGRTAVLVPTPGQTEQEYLARYLSGRGLFHSMEQEGFNLGEALLAGQGLTILPGLRNDPSLLEARINGLRDRIRTF